MPINTRDPDELRKMGWSYREQGGGDTEAAFEAGKEAERDAFWDSFQTRGEKQTYPYAFAYGGWNDETFCPKYDMQPSNANYMFAYNGYASAWNYIVDLKGCLEKAGVILDTSKATLMNHMFYTAKSITRIPTISFESITSCTAIFGNCSGLVSIDKLIFKSDGSTKLNEGPFTGCGALKHLTIEGVIGNSLSFAAAYQMTVDSARSIIDHLKNYRGTEYEGTYSIKLADAVWTRLNATTPPEGYVTWQDYVMDLGWNV